jgi:hypothetical protein
MGLFAANPLPFFPSAKHFGAFFLSEIDQEATPKTSKTSSKRTAKAERMAESLLYSQYDSANL